MEKPIGKLRKTRNIPIQKGNRGSVARNVGAHDLLRKQLHSSFDLNQPAQIGSPNHEVNFGVNSFF